MGRWNGGNFTRDSGLNQGEKDCVEMATDCPFRWTSITNVDLLV